MKSFMLRYKNKLCLYTNFIAYQNSYWLGYACLRQAQIYRYLNTWSYENIKWHAFLVLSFNQPTIVQIITRTQFFFAWFVLVEIMSLDTLLPYCVNGNVNISFWEWSWRSAFKLCGFLSNNYLNLNKKPWRVGIVLPDKNIFYKICLFSLRHRINARRVLTFCPAAMVCTNKF